MKNFKISIFLKNILKKMLNLRCAKVEELINLLEYDTMNQTNTEKNIDSLKIRDLVKDLISLFGKTSKSEIEALFFEKNHNFEMFFKKVNFKARELDKKNLDYQILLSRFKKLSERNENLQSELNTYKSIRADLMNDNFKSQKLLLHEKKSNFGFL